MRLAIVAATLIGCGGHAVTVDEPRALRRDAVLPTTSSEITLAAGDRRVPGTIVKPTVAGRWPAIVLLAGSGPTDRDWGSPTLATDNGSGKLLAAELASRGAVVLRFDKAGAGANPGPAPARLTLDTFRDEALAAIAYLRTRADVRADRIFVAGHSEGGVHATRVALAAGPAVAGVIYLSSVSRTMAETLLDQLEGNLTTPMAKLVGIDATSEMATLRTAIADFLAGRPVDPHRASTVPALQRLIAAIIAPHTAGLTRTLFRYDTAAEAPRLAVPVFVLGGGKDVQVDPERDARRLAEALRRAGRDVTFHIAPDADHVLKHEPKPLAELRADLAVVNNNYNADDRNLDANAITALVGWLASRTR